MQLRYVRKHRVFSQIRTVLVHQHYYFFFNDTATTEIYTLSLHDALPISRHRFRTYYYGNFATAESIDRELNAFDPNERGTRRSEEHTSELQSQSNLVCRLLLEKKKKIIN